MAATHGLLALRSDAWLTQPDHWGCSCGSAMWVDLTSAVCVDTGQVLGWFNPPRHEVAYTVNYSDSHNDEHPHGLEFRFVDAGGNVGSLRTRWFATEEDRRLFEAGDSLIDVRLILRLVQAT